MSKTTKRTVAKMSAMVIECELRAAWADVEVAIRHGVEPSKSLGDYIVELERARSGRSA